MANLNSYINETLGYLLNTISVKNHNALLFEKSFLIVSPQWGRKGKSLGHLKIACLVDQIVRMLLFDYLFFSFNWFGSFWAWGFHHDHLLLFDFGRDFFKSLFCLFLFLNRCVNHDLTRLKRTGLGWLCLDLSFLRLFHNTFNLRRLFNLLGRLGWLLGLLFWLFRDHEQDVRASELAQTHLLLDCCVLLQLSLWLEYKQSGQRD